MIKIIAVTVSTLLKRFHRGYPTIKDCDPSVANVLQKYKLSLSLGDSLSFSKRETVRKLYRSLASCFLKESDLLSQTVSLHKSERNFQGALLHEKETVK